MISAFQAKEEAIRHLTIYEFANRTSRIVTLCGEEFGILEGYPYLSIPKRAETCKQCALTLDETRRIMDR